VRETDPVPSARQAHVLFGAGLAGLAAVIAMLLPLRDAMPGAEFWAIPFSVAFVGGALASRARPDNVAARRLLAFGAVAITWFAASGALVLLYDAHGAGGAWFVPLNTLAQILGIGLVTSIVALLAVYPDGVYQRDLERRAVRVLLVLTPAVPVLLLVAGSTIQPAWFLEWADEVGALPALGDVDSPLGVDAPEGAKAPLTGFLDAALGAVPLFGAILLALRYRRFPVEQRLQIKWPLYAAMTLVVLALFDVLDAVDVLPTLLGDLFEMTSLVLLPAALAIGLAWPHLFDIEGVARRSAVYLALWTAIAAAYVGVAAAAGLAAGGENLQVAVAVAILTTLLFEPARRALARRVSRLAYGERVGGEELVRRLGAALEHTLETDALAQAIADTAREGLGARWARLVLDGARDALAGAPRPGEPAALTAPLVHAGEVLGEIQCGASARGRVYTGERELLTTLAGQAALALHNARLAAEVRERLDELAASRARIVEAEETARRRIERDIHDGSQQELAALIARIALVRNQVSRGDHAPLGDTLEALQSEAGQALENLRELASGIHPSVLTDRGIVAAIQARAVRLPLDVTVTCDPALRGRRFPEAVEGAVYFLVSECFSNTLKHAAARSVVLTIGGGERDLVVEVSDDGAGFDPDAVQAPGGLAGMADRIAALGGTLAVTSSPGAGTSLRAVLPLAETALV
jgi:signal transduction histidine kinase